MTEETMAFQALAVLLLLAGCSTVEPKTNAQKCADAGGVYNSASNSCQYPAELKKK
jgi:uncharacterized protein YceK